MSKKIPWIIGALIIIGLLAWLYIASMKPLPGEPAIQGGRDHKVEGSKIEYKFNPPTSGDHYPSWITKGFYEEPRSDGNVIHSQEHGYIIIWYECGKIGNRVQGTGYSGIADILIKPAYAQRAGMTGGSEGSPSAKLEDLPEAFRNGSCDSLKAELKKIYQSNQHKLIVMPRVGMDSPIILTAWQRMEKLNSMDKNKINEFINAFRDQGPEHTSEP